jgi:hypothetical protein
MGAAAAHASGAVTSSIVKPVASVSLPKSRQAGLRGCKAPEQHAEKSMRGRRVLHRGFRPFVVR